MTEPPVWQNQGYLKLMVQQWCAFYKTLRFLVKMHCAWLNLYTGRQITIVRSPFISRFA